MLSNCKHGHDRNEWGITKDGTCYRCKLDYQNRYRKRPEVKERRYELNRRAAQKYWQKHKLRRRSQRLFRTYGIDSEVYEQMLLAQEDRCAVCGEHSSKFKRRLAVDHDHLTGKVRGLLCDSCNGCYVRVLEDKTGTVQKAIEYLRKQGSVITLNPNWLEAK